MQAAPFSAGMVLAGLGLAAAGVASVMFYKRKAVVTEEDVSADKDLEEPDGVEITADESGSRSSE